MHCRILARIIKYRALSCISMNCHVLSCNQFSPQIAPRLHFASLALKNYPRIIRGSMDPHGKKRNILGMGAWMDKSALNRILVNPLAHFARWWPQNGGQNLYSVRHCNLHVFSSTLSYTIVYYHVVSCIIVFIVCYKAWQGIIMYYRVFSCLTTYCRVLSRIIVYDTVLSRTVVYYCRLSCIITRSHAVSCTIIYSRALLSIIVYYDVLCV